jgi:imidazolonepropionase-like amidohydrolase
MGYQKLLVTAPVHQKAYAKAIKAGVKVALGSDLGISVPGSIVGHGKNAWELKYAVDAGMTALQAIEAATATAPETLGPRAPSTGSGQPKEEFEADFIAVAKKPLGDIEVLVNPVNITDAWRRGQLCKSPESPVVSRLLG